ncbi:MAG: hypothetical protein B7Z11_02955, partial [Acidovorax sp. 32-64-7]
MHATKETMSSPLFKSLSISARLGLGFGCLLVLLVAMATVGQLSLNQVNTRMQEMTGAGATKTKLVNSMLESNPVPTFWITNHLQSMDRAYRRRFDL